ncbi:MAG: creatininase family protein [Firmicutes bacterium]|nr:creatininase family protein [Bacillota bacterium]
MKRTIAHMPWIEVKAAIDKQPLALVPIGATEVYGPHMPQGNDGIVAEELAVRIQRQVGGVVAPLIPVGDSTRLSAFPGTLVIDAETVYRVVRGIGESLYRAGCRSLLVVNGHAGNVDAINRYLEEASNRFRRAAQVDVWRLAGALGADLFEGVQNPFAHGGASMTSVMLALHPEWVDRSRMGQGSVMEDKHPAGVHLPPLAARFQQRFPEGYGGDVTGASAEAGRELLRRMETYLLRFLREEGFVLEEEG